MGIPELRRKVGELDGDVVFLYEQLERINNRLKQRASRQAHAADDPRPHQPAADDRPEFVAPFQTDEGEEQRSESLAPSTQLQATSMSKEQLRQLARQRGLLRS